MLRKHLLLLPLLCLSYMMAMGQKTYEWQASVPAPEQQGYHRILLPPSVTGRLRPDLADLRLYNAAQQEVPYLLEEGESYTAIPVQEITRTDSTSMKQTYIHLQLPQPAYPDLLKLHVTSPGFYLRQGQVTLGKPASGSRRKRRRRNRIQSVQVPFTTKANEPTSVELPRQQVEELTIRIENEDNPPLEIAGVEILQRNCFLVANLKAGASYTLRFGNKAATAPVYDLKFFRDSIPEALPVLAVTEISARENPELPQEPASKAYIWAAIGAVVIGLGYMTVRLLNEMNRDREKK